MLTFLNFAPLIYVDTKKRYFCKICGNRDIRYFGFFNGKPYCRRCISFLGEESDEDFVIDKSGEIKIDYELTAMQKKVSKELLDNFLNKKNSLLYAVTGAGKTETVFEIISYCIKHNLKVGYTVPRKDVIIELYRRFSATFSEDKICALYGEHTKEKTATLILLTTHQLYRFYKYFDLLILDELDAFPFSKNKTLNYMFQRAIRGNYVLLTATPSDKLIENIKANNDKVITLLRRYHNHDLPVPKMMIGFGIVKYIYLIYKCLLFMRENKPFLVFVSSISESKRIFNLLNIFIKKGSYANSKRLDRNLIVDRFRKGFYKYLVTTSILERGVTIPNLQVIIFDSDKEIFTSEALIQISGRVGRSKDYPEGEVIYIGIKKTRAMQDSISKIIYANRST